MNRFRARLTLILASAGHFAIDSYAGFFPIYIAMRDLNLLKAGLVATAASLVGNSLQPLFGAFADRVNKKWVIVTALAVGPLLHASIGLTADYALLAFFVIGGQLMVSFFHPAGADLSTRSDSGDRSSLNFAIFTTVGSLGYAVTGFVFYHFCSAFGFSRSWLLAIPGFSLALLLAFVAPDLKPVARPAGGGGFFKALRGHRRFIGLLYALVVIRCLVQVGLIYSLPSLFKEWGYRESLWSLPHFLFITTGAAAMLVCGIFENRIDPVRLIRVTMVAGIPIFFLFLYAGHQGSVLAFPLVALFGVANFSAVPANVVLGQRRVPAFAGTVSGILMGAGWAMAAVAPLLISAVGTWGIAPPAFGRLMPGLCILGILPLFGGWLTGRLEDRQILADQVSVEMSWSKDA